MYLGILIAISHEHKKSSQMKTQLKPPSYYSTVVSFIIHATAHDDWKIARIAKPRTFKSLIASVFKLQNVT